MIIFIPKILLLARLHELEDMKLLIGVCGGIAAYKSLDLIRRCDDLDIAVKVILTKAATKFITPLTCQTLSKQPVATSLFDLEQESTIGHIKLAQTYPLILIAPATANLIAKLAHGIADDLLTTVCLASDAKIIIAPAMNELMWNNPATKANLATLAQRGMIIVPPESGYLACETIGQGRLASIENLLASLLPELSQQPALAGKKALVTLGATIQPIDPFRYISNPASGKTGYEIALALMHQGAEVTVLAGLTHSIPAIVAKQLVKVKTTAEMAEQFSKLAPPTGYYSKISSSERLLY